MKTDYYKEISTKLQMVLIKYRGIEECIYCQRQQRGNKFQNLIIYMPHEANTTELTRKEFDNLIDWYWTHDATITIED
jgi:hypothetical protein